MRTGNAEEGKPRNYRILGKYLGKYMGMCIGKYTGKYTGKNLRKCMVCTWADNWTNT